MKRDHESTDLESAAKLAADEAILDPPPDPSEYAEPCRVCGEVIVRSWDRVCPRCVESMEYDRLERESGR